VENPTPKDKAKYMTAAILVAIVVAIFIFTFIKRG